MPKALFPKFWRTELDIIPPEENPDISIDVQQTLDRLMVWDAANQIWRTAVCDVDGRIIISTSGLGINLATYGAINVALAATLYFPQNPERRFIMIQNIGTVTSYIGFSAALTAANGLILPVGAVFTDDRYTGDLWMISSGGATCAIRWMLM